MTTTTRARYQICPRCRANQRMGPVIKHSQVAVQCYYCGFRGPEVPVTGSYTAEEERAAIDGWNRVERTPPKQDERTPERQEEEELGQWQRWVFPIWFAGANILLFWSLRFLLLHAGDENTSHVYAYAILVLVPVSSILAFMIEACNFHELKNLSSLARDHDGSRLPRVGFCRSPHRAPARHRSRLDLPRWTWEDLLDLSPEDSTVLATMIALWGAMVLFYISGLR